MTEDPPTSPALLPAGLRDLLPPDAETEAASVEALMDVFAAHGYQRVKPPLLEFEDSLLAGSGAAVAEQTFRLMDPDTPPHDGAARRHHAAGRPHRHHPAGRRAAAAAAVLCRAVPARARQPAARRTGRSPRPGSS